MEQNLKSKVTQTVLHELSFENFIKNISIRLNKALQMSQQKMLSGHSIDDSTDFDLTSFDL